jgi:hypothetical protein
VWPGPPPDHIAPSPADRCRLILLDDYTLTNAEVALRARVDRALVKRVRYQLVSVGALPPSRVVEKRGPVFKDLPRPPWMLTQGSCVAGGHDPDLWHSDVPAERERAKAICRGCPVIEPCTTWSLSLPSRDLAIYGGLSAADRERERAVRAGLPPPASLTAKARHAVRDRKRAERRAREAGGAA